MKPSDKETRQEIKRLQSVGWTLADVRGSSHFCLTHPEWGEAA